MRPVVRPITELRTVVRPMTELRPVARPITVLLPNQSTEQNLTCSRYQVCLGRISICEQGKGISGPGEEFNVKTFFPISSKLVGRLSRRVEGNINNLFTFRV